MPKTKKKHSTELQEVLSYMIDILGTEFPTTLYIPEYLIVAILDSSKCHANMILDMCVLSEKMDEIRMTYTEVIKSNLKPIIGYEKKFEFSDELARIFDCADKEASKLKSKVIGSEHVLLSILNPNNNIEAAEYLRENGIDYDFLAEKCAKAEDCENEINDLPINTSLINNNSNRPVILPKGNINPKLIISSSIKNEFIKQYTLNINELSRNGKTDSLIGRSKEIKEIIKVLGRRKKNNVILCGKPGVGKTSIVYGLAALIEEGNVPERLEEKEIIMLNAISLVSGTHFRGMFEERVNGLFNELKASNGHYILFIDDIQTVLKNGGKEKDGDLSDMIGNILSEGEVRVIATIGFKDYRNAIENNSALSQKFQKIIIEPETIENAVEILMKNKKYYEDYHHVTYNKETITHAVEMAERFITDRYLPDSAFDIIDLAGADAALSNTDSEEIKKLKKKLIDINEKKNEALNNGEFEKIDAILIEENSIAKKLSDFQRSKQAKKSSSKSITEDDINKVVSEVTSMPLSKLTLNEKERISNIDKILKKCIIGQDEAIDDVCRIIKRNRIGLGNNDRCAGSFLFCGKSAVGKTMLAKKLASEIYGDEKALIRFDMSEYEDKTSVNKLIGASAGYVGYDNGGQLTEAIKNKPYCVLLLDEIEKADSSVYNIFLQVLDEGRLTDNAGQTVNFKNVIVIMTSNIGAREAAELGKGVGFVYDEDKNKQSIIRKSLKKQFSPEFLNRIDQIVFFNSLTEDNLKQITKLEVKKLGNRLENSHYKLQYGDDVIEYIFAKAIKEKEYGARPIIRLVEDNIENKITDLLLQNDYKKDYEFSAGCCDNEIKII
jgi:ATP-dependent Clp protease ATP-binding subunit ClpC